MMKCSPPLGLRMLLWLLRRGVTIGYKYIPPDPLPQVEVDCFAQHVASCEWWRSGRAEVLVIVPSTCDRCSAKTHANVLDRILDQLEGVSSTGLAFALQDTDTKRLGDHLDSVGELLGSRASRVLLCPVLGLGKTAALNALMSVFPKSLRPEIVGWVDDDVLLGHGTLARMVAEMRGKTELLVAGARKEPVAYNGRIAKIFLALKRQARPPGIFVWPHGCAMMVRTKLIAGGIPLRYGGEDGYFILSVFDRSNVDPGSTVGLVDGTSCCHVVGGPGWQIPARVIRTLFENSVLLADFPQATSLAFAERAIFHGLYAPSAPFAARALGVVHYFFYLTIGFVLLARGLLGSPKHTIAWSAYTYHDVDRSEDCRPEFIPVRPDRRQ